MDVSIVIVNYKVLDLLNRCIISIISQTFCRYEIIVVDNNSRDDSSGFIKNKYPTIKFLQNNSNIGFARANNQAFKQATGRYIFMLNPDTVVLDGAIDKLVKFMDSHTGAGACGPKNLNPDGSLQRNCHHFPTIMTNILTYLQFARKYPRSRIFGKEFMTYWDYDEIKKVDWITGSSLMIRKKVLDEVGFLDENYFIYSEEADFCFKLKKHNWEVFFYPGASIIHYKGQSALTRTDEVIASGIIVAYLSASKYYFFKKNYGYLPRLIMKMMDCIYYTMVYTKNLLRKRGNAARAVKLTEATAALRSVFSL